MGSRADNKPKATRSEAGQVAAIVRTRRKAKGWTQDELARAAGTSRSTVLGAETGTLPRLGLAIRIGKKLGVPARDMLRAHCADALREYPDVLPELVAEQSGLTAHWSNTVEHQGLLVEEARNSLFVSDTGDATIRRRYTGCRATRSRRSLVFWHRGLLASSPRAGDAELRCESLSQRSRFQRPPGDWRRLRLPPSRVRETVGSRRRAVRL